MRLPYLERYKLLNGFKIYVVDGEFIRTEKDVEFSNYGQHYKYPYIPTNEFWLDDTASQGRYEYKYYVQHMLVEHSLMSKGIPYRQACEVANKAERELRSRDIDGRPIKKKQLGRIGKLKIWLVEGEQVRDKKDVGFAQGGNDLTFKYIPKDEIWVDDSLNQEERPQIILHEAYQRERMAQGESFEEAHEEASYVEKVARKKKGWKRFLPISLPSIGKSKKTKKHKRK